MHISISQESSQTQTPENLNPVGPAEKNLSFFERSSFQNQIFPLFLAILATIVGVLYAYTWRFGYNPDYTMIGLFAKRMIQTGEHFIFVPKVGYNGLLLETQGIALMFRLFGVSPFTLNLGAFLFFAIFCFVFRGALKAWHGVKVANLSLLFLILSSPYFHERMQRTAPNYPETFLMGCGLFWLYRKILERVESGSAPSVFQALLFGFITGFAVYTNGQIIFFLGAIGVHAFFLALKDTSLNHLPMKTIGAFFLFGLVSFLANWDLTLKLQDSKQLGIMPFKIVQLSVVALILSALVRSMVNHRDKLKSWALPALTLLLGTAVGLAPKYYYRWVLREGTLDKFDMHTTASEFASRFRIFVRGHDWIFNSSKTSPMSWVATVVSVICIFYFFRLSFRALKSYLAHENTQPSPFSFSPFHFLFWVNLGAFCSASIIVDKFNFRYATVLVLVYSLAFAQTTLKVLSLPKSRSVLKAAALVGIAAILWTNTRAIGNSYLENQAQLPVEAVANFLKEKNIHYGYADYWHAYDLNFLTNESIIIEPLMTPYIPFYFGANAPEKRIAYIDKQPYILRLPEIKVGQVLGIGASRYMVVEHSVVAGTEVFILQAI